MNAPAEPAQTPSLKELPNLDACALTVGSYDGLHQGHQSVLRRLIAAAESRGLKSVLLTLEPSPREFFHGAADAPRIGSLQDKRRLVEQFFPQLDRLVVFPFDAKTAAMDAPQFLKKILLGRLGMRYLTVGEDFRFGRDRAGDFALLAAASEQEDFDLERAPTFEIDGERVSSTRVRGALAAGDIAAAEHLLGHPFEIHARVAVGDRRGREIGFPTANLDFPHNPPVRGVFAVTAGIDGRVFPGVANVGTRPTVDGSKLLIEAHLLNFVGEVYGQNMTVRFHQRLRAEQRFGSVEELRAQIRLDVEAARTFFADD